MPGINIFWVFVQYVICACIYCHVKKLQVATWADRWDLHTSVSHFSDERLFFLHVYQSSSVHVLLQYFLKTARSSQSHNFSWVCFRRFSMIKLAQNGMESCGIENMVSCHCASWHTGFYENIYIWGIGIICVKRFSCFLHDDKHLAVKPCFKTACSPKCGRCDATLLNF